jgi:hypothetical protein
VTTAKSPAARVADLARLERRRHHAVEPGALRHPRQLHHVLHERPRHAHLVQRRLVHAGEHGDADDERLGRRAIRAVSTAALAAACIIGTPPEACTLIIHAPVSVAASTACATVFGMSWNLRSRNTASRLGDALHEPGPSSVNRRLPIFTPPTRPFSCSASCSAARAAVHVEGD